MPRPRTIRVEVPSDDAAAAEPEEEDTEDEEASEESILRPSLYRDQKPTAVSRRREDLKQLVVKSLVGDKTSEQTISTYVARLGVLRERFHEKQKKPLPDAHDHRWLCNHGEIIRFVEREWTHYETRKITYEALIKATSVLHEEEYAKAIEEYRKKQTEVAGLSDTRYVTQAMSESEKKKWVDWPELLQKCVKFRDDNWPRLASRLSWSEDDFRLFQELLALSVYVISLPPLRLEWREVKVKGIDRRVDNYVDFHSNPIKVCMQHFKTSKFYDKNILDVTDATLVSMLKRARELAEESVYLFQNSLGEQYITRSAFGFFISKTMERITGKAVGASMIRKIYVSHQQDRLNVPRTIEIMGLETLSRQMGHSPAQQAKYRRVGGDNLDDMMEQVEQMRTTTPGHTRSVQSTVPMNDRLMGGINRRRQT